LQVAGILKLLTSIDNMLVVQLKEAGSLN